MYFYTRQVSRVLVWFSLVVAGVTNLQIQLPVISEPVISESRVGDGLIISSASSPSHDRELIPIEPIRRIEINAPRMS